MMLHILIRRIVVFLLIVVAAGCDKNSPSESSDDSESINSLQEIVDDMRLPHESRPHGVPYNVDWAVAPRIGMGNDSEGFKAFITWGQLYEAIEGNPAENSRVELRMMEAWMLSKSDLEWHLLQEAGELQGAAYREDFADDANVEADMRAESDSSISVTAGNGTNFHFWPRSGRVDIDPEDIGGIFTTIQARLVVGDTSKEDDREFARYVLSVGADYWLSKTAQWDYWTTNGDVGIGRFKYVKSDWRAFNMSTLAEKELKENPPPIH